jgi:predicted AlkP superfamily phosphohydrolase/phosphomutase
MASGSSHMRHHKKPRRPSIVMLGVDAASMDVIQENLARLPNFARLLAKGAHYPLASWGDIAPGAVWPSFATGTTPGDHGIYHHIQWNAATMRLQRISADWLGYQPFWRHLAAAGRNVCVVDVPMTFPAPDDQTLEILTFASHDELVPFHCNRAAVARDLRQRFRLNAMGHEIPVSKSVATLKAVRDRLIASARQKGELTRWLLGLDDWDLFISIFGETHRGGHLLWSPPEQVHGEGPSGDLLEVYAALDASLGSICEAVDQIPGATLILFAVHGMQRDVSRAGAVPFVMDRINRDHDGPPSGASGLPRQRSLMRYLREMVPAPVQHAIGQAVPVAVKDWVVERAVAGGHDWSKTPGLALLADLSGYIRLNVKGREAKGLLRPESPGEERYIALIDACLHELVDAASGEKLVREVCRRPSLFQGKRADLLPDLFVLWRDVTSSGRARSERLGLLPQESPTGRSGNHSRDGFAVIVGSLPGDGAPPPKAVTDLGPLVSASLGVGMRDAGRAR